VQLLVEQRLPLGQLDRDPELVLLRLHDCIRALPLGLRHVLPELGHVVIVFHALGDEPSVDGDHRNEPKPEDEDESWISASEIAPGTAAPVAFRGAVCAPASLRSRLLLRSEDLHSLASRPLVRGDYITE